MNNRKPAGALTGYQGAAGWVRVSTGLAPLLPDELPGDLQVARQICRAAVLTERAPVDAGWVGTGAIGPVGVVEHVERIETCLQG